MESITAPRNVKTTPPPEIQAQLPFWLGDATDRESRALYLRALLLVHADIHLCRLVERVFDARNTAGGWVRMSYKQIAQSPHWLMCSAEKVRTTIEHAESLGIVTVDRSRDPRTGAKRENGYAINWEGIKQLCGIPSTTPRDTSTTPQPTFPTPQALPAAAATRGHGDAQGQSSSLACAFQEREMRIANPPKYQTKQTSQTSQVGALDSGGAQMADCRPASEIFPAAIDAAALGWKTAAHPAAQIQRLTSRILNVVPELNPDGLYLADWAARLVILEECLPASELDKILGDVQAMREAGSLKHGGKLFNSLIRKTTARHGIPWCPIGTHRQRE